MTVKPAYFVKSMRQRWAENGLQSSKPLEEAWHEMAVTFNDHIQGKVIDEWSVLPLPTGSGKTQGLALYCSLLSEQQQHPGVLIITKFTGEIDKLVSTINRLPYLKSALAEHSKLQERPTLAEMHSAPVIAITHSMYKHTLDQSSQDDTKALWEKFTNWERGERKLIVIDEALDVIEPVDVSHDLLRIVRGWIPRRMEIEQPEKIQTLDAIISRFHEWEKTYPNEYDKEVITADFWSGIKQAKITELRDDLCKLPLGKMIVGGNYQGSMSIRCRDIFSDIVHTLSNQSWYERKKGVGALKSAYVALPTHINNAVIMDATAQQSRAYDLLGAIPNFRPMPEHIRNYKNVGLHILYGYQNSKYHLIKPEHDEQHFLDVMDALDPAIPENAKLLFVTFEDVSKKFSKVRKKYKGCKVSYWGNINGKNEWSDCSAIVIYGLPRLDAITPESAILAFENWHNKTNKKYDPPHIIYEEAPDGSDQMYFQDNFVTDEEYERGHIAAEIIQAINRVQCRNVTDDMGSCSPTQIYMLFNKGDKLENFIVEEIKKAMPNIQVIYSDAPTVQKKKVRSKIGQEVMKALAVLPKREHVVIDLINNIRTLTGIGSDASRSTFTRNCKTPNSPEATALAELGYIYQSDVKGGKGNKAIFKPV